MYKLNTEKINNKKHKNNAYKNIIINILLPVTVYLIVTSVFCMLIYITDMNVYENYLLIVLSFGFSCFISAYLIGRRIRKNGLITGNIFNILPTLIFILISLILNSFSFDYRLAILILIHLIFSSVGGIISVNSKKHHYNRKKRR